MNKNYDFHVLENTDLEAFENDVKKLLEQGWELHGQMIAFPNTTEKENVKTVRYIQAMKKELRPEGGMGFKWA